MAKIYVCDNCGTQLGEIACKGPKDGAYCSVECINEAEKSEVLDLIANLARRMSSLEQQLSDAQRNIERMGYEQSEAEAKVEMLLKDIVMLDERTQSHYADVVTFENFLDSIAEKVATKLIGGGCK